MAPLAVMVELWPAQIDAGEGVTVSDGNGVTVTVTVVVSLQPASSPISVYVVVDVGLTVSVVANEPVLHV